jgi:hypothetical protein
MTIALTISLLAEQAILSEQPNLTQLGCDALLTPNTLHRLLTPYDPDQIAQFVATPRSPRTLFLEVSTSDFQRIHLCKLQLATIRQIDGRHVLWSEATFIHYSQRQPSTAFATIKPSSPAQDYTRMVRLYNQAPDRDHV